MHRRNEACIAHVPIGQKDRTVLWPGIAERYNWSGGRVDAPSSIFGCPRGPMGLALLMQQSVRSQAKEVRGNQTSLVSHAELMQARASRHHFDSFFSYLLINTFN
jgi:hypothetical protein